MKVLSAETEFKESFYKIALPSSLQMLLMTSLAFVDSIMVGSLGQFEYNAVGLAGQYTFIASLFNVGIVSSVMIYMSQFYGAKEFVKFRGALGFGVIFALTISSIFMAVAVFLPVQLMSLFTDHQQIIDYGVSYLTMAGLQFPFMALTLSFSYAFKASKNATVPLIVSLVSFSLNSLLNYFLIYGILFFPPLGVRGAAIATVLSRSTALVLYLVIIFSTQNILRAKLSDFFSFTKKFIVNIFRTGWSVILHECFWSVGISSLMFIVSRERTDAYSSFQIASSFSRFMMVFSLGVSSAASITIGALLGRKNIDAALKYEKKYSIVQMIMSIISAVVIIGLIYLLIDVFNVSEEIKYNAIVYTVIICIFNPMKFYSGMQAAGILRAGGDTKWPVLYEVAPIYLIKIPLLLVLLRHTNLPFSIILPITYIGDFVTFILIYMRVKSRKWAKNLIEGI